MIDIRQDLLKTVKSILAEHVPEYEVRAFGSRVTWTAKDASDLDLVVVGEEKLPWKKMAGLKAAFEESKIPFRMDVLDWNAIPENFRENIGKKFEVVQRGATKEEQFKGGSEKPAETVWHEEIEFSEIRLGDVCEKIGSGATPRGGNSVYLDNGAISLIRSQNVYNDGFHKDGLVYISQQHADELKNVEVKNGDLLLNITGDSVARCCQVDPNVLPARVNQHVVIIRPNEEMLHKRYLRYYMISPTTQGNLLSMSAAGATRPALTKGMIEEFKVSAPDQKKQRAIAYILGTLDDKIELNRRINTTLEEIARAIYKSWFVDFDLVRKIAAGLPTGLPEEIEKLFPKEFEKSELGEIPKGWNKKTIDDICDVTRGASPRPINDFMDGEVPWIKIADATAAGGYFIFSTKEKVKREGASKSVEVHPGDLIMSNSASCGIPIFVQIEGCIHDGWLLFRNFKNISAGYLFNHLLTISSYLIHIADGSVQKNLNTDLVGKQPILIPSPSLIIEFDKSNATIINQMLFYSKQIIALSNLRDALLPRLLSGSLPIRGAEKFLREAGL